VSIVLTSASPGATEEKIREVFEKNGLEPEAPEVVETPKPVPEPKRDDYEAEEEFEAAQTVWQEASGTKESEKTEEPKRLSRLQRRVQRETSQLRSENDELRRRLEALEGKKTEEATPEENPRPKRADFNGDEEYEDALLAWGTERALAKRQAEEAQNEQQRALEQNYQNYRTQVEEFKDEHDDWEDVVGQDIPMHTAVQLALLEQTNGAEVTYYLGKHPDFTRKLAAMSPLSAVVEVGVLSRKLQSDSGRTSGPANAREGETKTITKPKAPAPVQPVRTGTTLASMSSIDAAKNGDYKAFKRAQRAGR